MRKICVFDLDGTLLNTLESIAYYVNKALANRGFGSVPTEKIRQFIGRGARNLLLRSLEYTDAKNADVDGILKEYIKLYNSDALYLVKPYDGIFEMLERLGKAGIKTAVLSNKPHSSTTDIIEAFFGKNYFYRYEGQREGVPIKPDPTSTLEIIDGFDKNGCFYIGDSPSDIETAHNAGIHGIAVTWGFRTKGELLAANPEYIADAPDDIVTTLLSV